MKKLLFLFTLLPAVTFAQTATENFTLTKTYKTPTKTPVTNISDIDKLNTTIQYMDGLGRTKQQVMVRGSGDQKDMIVHFDYDQYSRRDKDFLPYVSTYTDGRINATADQATDTYYLNKYGSDLNISAPNPFSQKAFDGSPLNRVLKQASPGYDWRIGGGHEIEFDYQTNVLGEVKLYKVNLNSDYTPSLSGGVDFYSPGELIKTVTKNENHDGSNTKNHTVEEFKNLHGQIILKREFNNNQAHDTYYVYDEFGNLTYVLPPKAEAHIVIPDPAKLNELVYQYKYDHRNRLIEKKLPGKGWEYIIYNRLDQPILTQDAIQRLNNEWLFTKYDAFGREVYAGLYIDNRDRITLQQVAISHNVQFEMIGGSIHGYTNLAFPLIGNHQNIYIVNYFDDYSFGMHGISVPSEVTSNNVKGLATGSKVRVLDNTANEPWSVTVIGYDAKGRNNYIANKNEYLNTTDIIKSTLDFTGKVVQTTTTHSKNNQQPIITIDQFTYDHGDRLIGHTQSINGGASQTIVQNAYDELGQLQVKHVGNGGLQQINYAYNIRGWLKRINHDSLNDNDLFNFGLWYNDVPNQNKRLFNGNISGLYWNTESADNSKKQYEFSYDELNRLIEAESNDIIGGIGKYNLNTISYDKNGNILNLQRNGQSTENPNAGNVAHWGLMDNLVYTYDAGNRLLKVTDNGEADYGFKDGSNLGNDYTYDVNGNMLTDQNKGITDINYNFLNLPTLVTIDGKSIEYVYDATGSKVRKIIDNNVTTDYAGNYIYENNTLQFFTHPEGYVTANYQIERDGNPGLLLGFSYVFQYKDHLGNVRLSYSDTDQNQFISQNEIIEESNYYPLGLKQAGYNNVTTSDGNYIAQKFGYNGKEFEDALGLNWNDYGARNYDASLGRWMNIDPLSEQMVQQSPYNYAFNNPIFFIDPDGMAPTDSYGNSLEGAAVEWSSSNEKDWGYTENGKNVSYETLEARNSANCCGFTNALAFQEAMNLFTIPSTKEISEAPVDFFSGLSNAEELRARSAEAKNINLGSIREYKPNYMGRLEERIKQSSGISYLVGSFLYGMADNIWVFATGFELLNPHKGPQHLNGYSVTRGSSEHHAAGLNGLFTTVTWIARVPLNSLNASQFSSMFKGNLARLHSSYRGKLNRVLNFFRKNIGTSLFGKYPYYKYGIEKTKERLDD